MMNNNLSVSNIIAKFIKIFFTICDNDKKYLQIPIDIVYLWVDGSDIEWQKEKEKWQKEYGIYGDVVNKCRFTDNQELRYSLRSVMKNIPWINNIFIVTNGQVPSWLDINHPKIHLITHDQIMPKDSLPTYNTSAIETCICNIPNLSEYFLFANDDMFVNKPLEKSYFFDKKGNPFVRMLKHNWSEKQKENYYQSAVTYAMHLVKDKYNLKKETLLEPAHNIDSYKKSYFLNCLEEFKDKVDKTVMNKFRTKGDIQRSIVAFYEIANNLCTLKKYKKWGRIKHPRETVVVPIYTIEKMTQTLDRTKPNLFCLNDDENATDENRKNVPILLSKLFDDIQPWEKDEMENSNKELYKTKVLVTGGVGFIGSHIVDELIAQNFNVVIIDNLSTGKLENINNKATFYKCDITSDEIDHIFKTEKPNIVIHLAAQVSVTNANLNSVYDAKENIIGTLNILEYCKKYNVNKIIAASSAAVYGNPKYLSIDENHPTEPMSQYGLSKLTAERYIQLSGIDYIICRFSNVYGERQTIEGEAGVVTIFENAMKNNEDITIYGDGNQVRDFIYVKDIAKIIRSLIDKNIKNEIINISTNNGTTINNLFDCLANKYSYTQKPTYADKRIADINKSILDNSKLLKILNYKFNNSLKINNINSKV